MDLVSSIKKGNRRAIAKAISSIENNDKDSKKLIKKIFKNSGKAAVIGFTGPAGAGKSSLINKITLALKKAGFKAAVLAIDPTSHLTGGAILGDRVRMSESTDSGTYIRSIATRGATGAVAHSIRNSIRILEYARFNPIIIESVGAGQTEVEISKMVDVTIVVFNPHTGDSIQAIKAGLTEIGDIYVINKSDLAGANQLYDAVRDYIGSTGKKPIILKASVKSNKGISELTKKIIETIHKQKKTKKNLEKSRLESELQDIILNNIKNKIGSMLVSSTVYSKYLKKVQSKELDPYDAADKISKAILK